ncbi:GYDIA family GHMP kinase [Maribacter chungangensis]|uniref:GYDIA family GHMP kinase n=1 Tax=Maribacter chungangensis TaxID=1069117 RepID=A0ABW3B6E5_9FLAO
MTDYFYSNGKLLLSGEYAILDGAEGWAIPTKFGQGLKITPSSSGILTWKSLDVDKNTWFKASYTLADFKQLSASDEAISKTLIGLLQEARALQPAFLSESAGCAVETELSFPRNWGLGTSSTLINNIAQWAKIDAYSLLKKTFGGSGYDLACAQHDHPILFKIEEGQAVVRKANPTLSFVDQLYFVYLNQKRNSREAIAAYRKRSINKLELTTKITEITSALIRAGSLSEFERLLNLHEHILSTALDVRTIKEQLFSDYEGSIKSLGGWGGDFLLVTARKNTFDYFKAKGYSTIISYSDMILKN